MFHPVDNFPRALALAPPAREAHAVMLAAVESGAMAIIVDVWLPPRKGVRRERPKWGLA